MKEGEEKEEWRKVKVLMPKKKMCARQMLDYAQKMERMQKIREEPDSWEG